MKNKPNTLEQNLSNIIHMKDNFFNIINNYIWEYNRIQYMEVNGLYPYYRLQRWISPYSTYELDSANLAYSVFGFTNDIYTKIAYALNYYENNKYGNKTNVTDKRYFQGIRILQKENKIDSCNIKDLLEFRTHRNFATHSGKVEFISYIFNHTQLIYNMLGVIEEILTNIANINNIEYYTYNKMHSDFINDLKATLDEFRLYNGIAV